MSRSFQEAVGFKGRLKNPRGNTDAPRDFIAPKAAARL
jgi:hypothetical protein